MCMDCAVVIRMYSLEKNNQTAVFADPMAEMVEKGTTNFISFPIKIIFLSLVHHVFKRICVIQYRLVSITLPDRELCCNWNAYKNKLRNSLQSGINLIEGEEKDFISKMQQKKNQNCGRTSNSPFYAICQILKFNLRLKSVQELNSFSNLEEFRLKRNLRNPERRLLILKIDILDLVMTNSPLFLLRGKFHL